MRLLILFSMLASCAHLPPSYPCYTHDDPEVVQWVNVACERAEYREPLEWQVVLIPSWEMSRAVPSERTIYVAGGDRFRRALIHEATHAILYERGVHHDHHHQYMYARGWCRGGCGIIDEIRQP